MSESSRWVDPRVEVVARALCVCNPDKWLEGPDNIFKPAWKFQAAGAEHILRALDEYEASKSNER